MKTLTGQQTLEQAEALRLADTVVRRAAEKISENEPWNKVRNAFLYVAAQREDYPVKVLAKAFSLDVKKTRKILKDMQKAVDIIVKNMDCGETPESGWNIAASSPFSWLTTFSVDDLLVLAKKYKLEPMTSTCTGCKFKQFLDVSDLGGSKNHPGCLLHKTLFHGIVDKGCEDRDGRPNSRDSRSI